MLRFALFASIAAGAIFLATSQPATSQQPASSLVAPSAASIVNEPVLIYSITGGTLTGSVHLQLTVYNNGFATIAKLNHVVFPAPGTDMDVQTAGVGPLAATQLLRDLGGAGAFQLQDEQLSVADIPLKTVTVMRGATDAKAHSYSYWSGGSGHQKAGQIIGDFVAKHFPSI